MQTATETNYAKEQAIAQLESIVEMVAALECDYDRLEELRDERNDCSTPIIWKDNNPAEAEELAELEAAAGECTNQDEARERINEDPLSVEVRTGWYAPGYTSGQTEFCILLCTGGPAVRIIGDLDEYKQPSRAYIQYQDWGTSWTDLIGHSYGSLLTYCQQFYFGE